MSEPWEDQATSYERAVKIDHGMINGSAAIWISSGHAPAWLVKELLDAINALYRVETGFDLGVQQISATSGIPSAEFTFVITGEPEALAKVVRTVQDIAKRTGPRG